MVVFEDKYFSPSFSCQVHKTHTVSKDKLTNEHMEMFNKMIFRLFLNVDIVFNSQLFHHFLFREESDNRLNIISFEILGKKVTF